MAKFKPKIPSGTQEPPTVRLPIPLYRPLPPPPERTSNDITRSPSHVRATHPRTCWYPLAAIAQAPALIVLQRWRMATKPTPTNAPYWHPLSSCCNDGGWPPNPHRPTPGPVVDPRATASSLGEEDKETPPSQSSTCLFGQYQCQNGAPIFFLLLRRGLKSTQAERRLTTKGMAPPQLRGDPCVKTTFRAFFPPFSDGGVSVHFCFTFNFPCATTMGTNVF